MERRHQIEFGTALSRHMSDGFVGRSVQSTIVFYCVVALVSSVIALILNQFLVADIGAYLGVSVVIGFIVVGICTWSFVIGTTVYSKIVENQQSLEIAIAEQAQLTTELANSLMRRRDEDKTEPKLGVDVAPSTESGVVTIDPQEQTELKDSFDRFSEQEDSNIWTTREYLEKVREVRRKLDVVMQIEYDNSTDSRVVAHPLLIEAMSELSNSEQNLFVWYYGSNASTLEIGELFQMSEDSVRRQLLLIRRKLMNTVNELSERQSEQPENPQTPSPQTPNPELSN